jgi:hypothetical protein
MVFFNAMFSMVLFAIGLGTSYNWQESVLKTYEIRCTLLPHPPQFPYQLIRLSEGKPTVKGFKELLVCDSEPLYGFEKLQRR